MIQWVYDDCLNLPVPFLSGDTNVPEELDLSDEEMKELAEWSEQEAIRLSTMDANKTVDKAITDALKEEGIGGRELR